MKKSTILSLATAIAVVGTSAFTFATWDQLEATNTGTLSLASPVKLSSGNPVTYTTADNTLSTDAPTYSSDVTFEVNDVTTKTITSLEITSVKVYENADSEKTDLADNFTISIDGTTDNTGVTQSEGKVIDSSVETENKYTIKLTPKNDTYAGKELSVDVMAKIQ